MKINKRIYITAIFIVPFVLLMLYGPRSFEDRLNKNESLREEIQFDINQLVEKRTELRLEKIDIMADWFNKDFERNDTDMYPIEQRAKLERFILSKMGMPYKLGGKGGGKLDCSGLFGTFAHYDMKLISYNDLINHYSAEIIRQNNKHKNLEDIQIGDLVYIIKDNEAVHIMYVYSIDKGNLTTLEANINSGVSYQEYRFIKGTEGIFLEQDGKVWDFDITHNSLIDMELIGDFLISSYIPTTVGMNINNGGKSGNHTASGLPLKDDYAGKIVACPKEYSIGLDGEPKQKLYIEGHGIVECSDRGGLIVMKGETNSRGNISSYNRLDLFAGMDTPKIEWNQKHANVYLIK